MATPLRQSTQVVVRVGSFVDSIDGVTPETGITLGAADQAEALKAGGVATVDISGNTWGAVTGADGWYNLTLTTTDTNTVGDLTIVVQDASVCLPVFVRFVVLEEAIYDGLYAASATSVPANVVAWNGTAPNNLVSGRVDADMGAISTDATAADSLETMLDGTGGNVLTLAQLRINSTAAGGAIDIDNSVGIAISARSSNESAVEFVSTGNDGFGLHVEGNATGHGINVVGGASGGAGMKLQAGAGGDGILAQGGTGSGNGIVARAQAGNSGGLVAEGSGTGPGLECLNSGTGPGLLCQGGPTNGNGANFVGSPTNAGDGIFAQGGLLGGAGARLQGVVDSGLVCGGDQASAIFAQGTVNGHGVEIIGGVNGHGIYTLGGNNAGDGIRAEADTSGKGINAIGAGAHAGIESVGGATGHGISALGGATSGDGIHTIAQTLGDGIEAVGAGGGFDINADIQGSLSGSVGSVTGNVGGDVQGNVDGNLGGTLSVAALAQINAEADTALADIRLDEVIQNAASPVTPTINSFWDRITSTDGTQTYDRATDSLQSIRDSIGGGGLTQQQVRDAMKLAPTAGAPAAGSVDEHLDDILADTNVIEPLVSTNLDATVSSRATPAQVNTEVDTALADIRLDELIQNAAAPITPTIDSFADRWTSMNGAQTYDRSTDSLEAIATAGGGGLTQQQVRDSMKLAPTVGAPAVGSVDEHLDTIEGRVDVATSTRATDAGASAAVTAAHGVGSYVDTGPAPTVAAIDAQLSGTHGAGNWEGGGAAPTVAQIDAQLSSTHGAGNWEGGGAGLTQQQVADALKLAPAAGAPAAGSVYDQLNDIESCACGGGPGSDVVEMEPI